MSGIPETGNEDLHVSDPLRSMQDFFVRKFWKQEDMLFYLHFKGDEAVRQIEISERGKTFLSLDNPIKGESILYDQSMNDLDLNADDFITRQEFEKIWQDGE